MGGHPTEVLELPAAGQPECTVLVVPGNPGAASYYTPFMRSLHSRLGGRAAVLAVSNLGMVGLGAGWEARRLREREREGGRTGVGEAV